MNANDVLEFWFNEIEPSQWWVKDLEFDQLIKTRYGDVHQQAAAGELFGWRDSAKGRLAEIIVLDQFSRNIYRDQPQSFAADAMALVLAQEAVALELDKSLSAGERAFLYMPYMHSESLTIHDVAVSLFESNGIQANVDFEMQHRAIIEKFGRYPHRNAILNRESTAAEIEFLTQPGSSF